ncbi:MAG: VWA domain-containing protein [Patescibacteria group bacterium]|nr:VWA domain-containing protein [Patescibacteria group bacterium]
MKIAFAFTLFFAAFGQNIITVAPKNSVPRKANLRVDRIMVLVPATVTDIHDHPVLNLTGDKFRISENGVEQMVVSASVEDGPISFGIVFDGSGSMKGPRIASARMAVDALLEGAIEGDEFLLAFFNDRPSLLCGFTPNPSDIFSRLSFVQPVGWTSLNDALILAAARMKNARNRRVLFVVSDGGDNNSRYDDNETFKILLESDVAVYTLGILTKQKLLQRLADGTGGVVSMVRSLGDVAPAANRLARIMRNRYFLGYYPRLPNDGRWRKIKVSIPSNPDLIIRARSGYWSPE